MAFQFGHALPCGRIVNSCCPFWGGIGIDINPPEMQDFTLPKVCPPTNELRPELVLPVTIPMLNLLNAAVPLQKRLDRQDSLSDSDIVGRDPGLPSRRMCDMWNKKKWNR